MDPRRFDTLARSLAAPQHPPRPPRWSCGARRRLDRLPVVRGTSTQAFCGNVVCAANPGICETRLRLLRLQQRKLVAACHRRSCSGVITSPTATTTTTTTTASPRLRWAAPAPAPGQCASGACCGGACVEPSGRQWELRGLRPRLPESVLVGLLGGLLHQLLPGRLSPVPEWSSGGLQPPKPPAFSTTKPAARKVTAAGPPGRSASPAPTATAGPAPRQCAREA